MSTGYLLSPESSKAVTFYARLKYSQIWDDLPDIHRIVLGNLHVDMLPYLTAHAQAVKARDSNGRSALWWAVSMDNLKLVHILVVAGADVNAQDVERDTALHIALRNNLSSKAAIVKTLLDHDLDLTLVNNYGEACLHLACNVECADLRSHLVRKSLQAGVHADQRTGYSHTALMYRTYFRSNHDDNYIEYEVELLLEAGADIDAQDKLGDTALMQTISGRRIAMTRFLLERGARCDTLNTSEENILHIAAKHSDVKIFKTLLDYDLPGVDPWAQDKYGLTPEDLIEEPRVTLGDVDEDTKEAFYTLLDKVNSQNRILEIDSD